MLQDRRQYQRVIPNQPVVVRWGESQCRLLFDLSEEGLAVDGFVPESAAEVITLSFSLPDGRGHIQAKGEVAWTNDSEDRTGLHFVNLAETSRQQLKEWISTSVYCNEMPEVQVDCSQAPLFPTHEADNVDLVVWETMGNRGLGRHQSSRYLTWLVVAAVSVFSGIAFARHYLGGLGNSWRTKEIMAAGKVPEIPAASIATAKASAPAHYLPPALPLNLPGLALQVAAMKHEDNADALAKTLQKKNFPAFVFQRGTDPFYRVAVGVYSDPDSAAQAKQELKAQGFQSILKHWSPV
jgi:hypothetical protein